MDAQQPRRVTLVANELRGLYPAGGMGTATTFLALALARMGHSVQILVSWQPQRSLDPYWSSVYAQVGVRIQRVPDSGERIEPPRFGVMRNVELGLRAEPPEVVIVHDLSAPAYSALRLRQLGLAFEDVLFVVFCHGTRRWVMEMSGKLGVRDVRAVLADSVLEQASLELADVVVSPSAYLVKWMRQQGWRLPERTVVIPYFTRSGASGETVSVSARDDGRGKVTRLAFFGRLEDKKGVRPFVAGLNRLDHALLSGIEVEFVGKTTTTWTAERIEALLSKETRSSLRRVSFETELDQHEALDRLAAPGTLVVMPSLGDNSPNTVYECLEHRIPFIASAVGGIPELIVPDDRGRILFEPTSAGVAEKLRRALSDGSFLRPAEPAFDSEASRAAWADVIETRPERPPPAIAEAPLDVVLVRRTQGELPAAQRAALDRQNHAGFRLIECEGESVEQARATGLRSADAPYVLFLDEADRPDTEFLATLARAQAASGADVVTCGVRLTNGNEIVRLFSGDPCGLGAVWNDYGTAALIRRALVEQVFPQRRADNDPDWPLLAALAASGAKLVSVPLPLVTRSAPPGTVEDSPGDALLVLEQLERAAPPQLRLVGRLAAGLATLDAGKREPVRSAGLRALLRRGRASR